MNESLDDQAAAVVGDISSLVRRARAAASVAEQRHARDLLERALLCADPGAVSASQRAEARKLGVAEAACEESTLEIPPHAVLVSLVIEPVGLGIVRYMRVAFDASAHGGYELGLDAEAARAVSEALERAALYLRRSAPAGYCLATVHPDALLALGSSALVSGPSLGAAAFVSAVSLWSERSVLAGTVVIGKLLGDRVVPVGALEAKLDAAIAGRSDVKRMIVPKGALLRARRLLTARKSRVELTGVGTLDELVRAALEETPRRMAPIRHRIAELRRDFERGWQGFRWPNVRENAERLLATTPEQNVELRVDLLTMLGATEEHLGAPLRSLEMLEQASRLCEDEAGKRWVPDKELSRLHQHLAITYRRLSRFGDARRAAARAVKDARRGRARDELFKSHGCAGLVELSCGRPAPAVLAFERALELVHEHAPESCVRSHAYLIEALALAGSSRRVEKEFETATDHLQHVPPSTSKLGAEAWLRTSFGAALWQLGQIGDACKLLDVPSVREAIDTAPLPGLLARRYLGLALLAQGRIEEGQGLLSASPFAYGSTLGPNLLFSAHINVLCEAWGVSSRSVWDRDIAGRARVALARFPAYLRPGAIERARKRALTMLQRNGRPNVDSLDALHSLITLCNRIA